MVTIPTSAEAAGGTTYRILFETDAPPVTEGITGTAAVRIEWFDGTTWHDAPLTSFQVVADTEAHATAGDVAAFAGRPMRVTLDEGAVIDAGDWPSQPAVLPFTAPPLPPRHPGGHLGHIQHLSHIHPFG
jgi:hypothetical protein